MNRRLHHIVLRLLTAPLLLAMLFVACTEKEEAQPTPSPAANVSQPDPTGTPQQPEPEVSNGLRGKWVLQDIHFERFVDGHPEDSTIKAFVYHDTIDFLSDSTFHSSAAAWRSVNWRYLVSGTAGIDPCTYHYDYVATVTILGEDSLLIYGYSPMDDVPTCGGYGDLHLNLFTKL